MRADGAVGTWPDPRGFGGYVRRTRAAGRTVVQPRMGFGDPGDMRHGLLATRDAQACTAGTLTLDSYTRVGDMGAARRALRSGTGLNGYPICTHDTATTTAVLADVRGPDFAVQVRHGSAAPQQIISASLDAGLDATEGGPVSYCLPYGRTPLADSVRNWQEACRLLAAAGTTTSRPHLESFGGCMMGQLCPPSLLVALTVLEAAFFCQHGLRSVSVSFAQQPDPEQNREAVSALRRLCADRLPGVDWHVVIYAYMGVYPTTPTGCRRVLAEAARLAADTGSERLIVKTVAEFSRIPTIRENVEALEYAASVLADGGPGPTPVPSPGEVEAEARALVDTVLGLHDDIGTALLLAFGRGLLDVPFCLHPDNAGRSRSDLDPQGRVRWVDTGAMPLPGAAGRYLDRPVTAAGLRESLSFMQRRHDAAPVLMPVGAATDDRPLGAVL